MTSQEELCCVLFCASQILSTAAPPLHSSSSLILSGLFAKLSRVLAYRTIVSFVEVLSEKPRTGARGRLGVAREPREREAIRQCFLFSNHLLITTRTHAGRSVAVCCNFTSISTLGTTYLQILIVDGKYCDCDRYTLYYLKTQFDIKTAPGGGCGQNLAGGGHADRGPQ